MSQVLSDSIGEGSDDLVKADHQKRSNNMQDLTRGTSANRHAHSFAFHLVFFYYHYYYLSALLSQVPGPLTFDWHASWDRMNFTQHTRTLLSLKIWCFTEPHKPLLRINQLHPFLCTHARSHALLHAHTKRDSSGIRSSLSPFARQVLRMFFSPRQDGTRSSITTTGYCAPLFDAVQSWRRTKK